MKSIYLKLVITFFCFFLITRIGYAQKSNVKLPSTYSFNWKMSMSVQTDGNTMVIDYYLKENEDYLGFSSEEISKQAQEAKVFIVMDAKRKVNATFMDVMGQKMLQKSSYDELFFGDPKDFDGIKIKEIGSKTILGYNCQGFETITEEYKMVFYVTNEVPVTYTSALASSNMAAPKHLLGALKKYNEKGSVLEMQIINSKKPKENVTITCKTIDKINFTIKTADYKSMF